MKIVMTKDELFAVIIPCINSMSTFTGGRKIRSIYVDDYKGDVTIELLPQVVDLAESATTEAA